MNEYWKFYFNPILWWPFRLQQNICCFPVSHAHDAFYKCSDFSELQVHECLWVCTFHHTCLCVRGEVVLSDKGTHLEPPGFIWAKQERGPCLSGPLFCPQWGLRATNRRCLLSTHTWAPPSLGPTSLSRSLSLLLSSSMQPLPSLSFTTLCILSPSLPGHGLAYFYLSHSGPFDVDCVGPFHRSCVHFEMAPLLNPQSVYEYTFHKQDM